MPKNPESSTLALSDFRGGGALREKLSSNRRPHGILLATLLVGGAACGPDGCGGAANNTGTNVGVLNDSVRACDLVFRAAGEEVPSVVFGGAVTGEAVPKAPYLAVSFIAREDRSLAGEELLQLVFTGEAAPAELISSTCSDGTGAVVSGDVLRLGSSS